MSRKSIIDDSITIHIKNAKVIAYFEDTVIDENEQKHIQSILDSATKNIYIDKTYVDFKGTKFEKTFISENGWHELCEVIYETNFGQKRPTKKQKEFLTEAYSLLILSYAYMFLEDLDYYSEGMYLVIPENANFFAAAFYDTAKEWKTYPGKWQTW